MPKTRIFPIQEGKEILSLYKQLRYENAIPFEGENYRLLRRAIVFAIEKNGFQYDVFGRNPLVNSLQTAAVLTEEIGKNKEFIQACLLAPFASAFVQETVVPECSVCSGLGESVDKILHGIMNIQQLYTKSVAIEDENFRNLLVSFAEDIRVILIMIAHRTNLMRQIRDTENIAAQRHLAEEAAYLYAPLAHKLGLYKIKSELEDLSLKYMEKEAYYHIKEKLSATKRTRDEYIERFIVPVKKALEDSGLSFHIKGRTKSIHSIWKKMVKQGCPFEGVYDLFAIRIILDSPLKEEKKHCWQAYSIVTDMYPPNPKRLRDWLSIPKSNGYESLHITVLGPENKWVEVQIRTERMDEIAEHGLAAHWRYKGVQFNNQGIDSWLANIRTALESSDDKGLLEEFKSELKADEVYVFTPHGDLHKLPLGATALDFAYSIHTNVGSQCTGVIVNGKNVPMRYVLQSGDQVNIITSPNQTPKQAWLTFAVTSRAKSKIRQSLKEQEVKLSGMGREIVERKFKNRKIDLDNNVLHRVIKRLGYKEIPQFYQDVVEEKQDVNDVVEHYLELQKHDANQVEHLPQKSAEEYNIQEDKLQTGLGDDELVIDKNIKGLEFSLSKCCNPIYGDDVFGFVTINNGIKIHRTDCPNAAALKARFGYRIVKARWAGKGQNNLYPITLRVVGIDDLGVVNNISSIISKEEHINMRSFSISANDGLFSGVLTIMIADTKELERLIKKLKTVKGVKNVMRGG